MRWPFVTRRERVRREAADWIALLNGPHEDAERAEFERWYASNTDHAAAYDRLSNLFDTAGRASRPVATTEELPARIGRPQARPLRYGLAIATVGAALLAFFFLSARTTSPLSDGREQFAAFSTAGEERRIALEDGSEMILSAGSTVEVSLSGNERRLRLTRGEARFSVAHERRPFVVDANGTEVIARGTRFIVRVASGATTVALIEGSVDVSYAHVGGGERRLTRLSPGERLVVESRSVGGSAGAPVGRAAVREPRDVAAPAMLEFDETPLEVAVEQANRGSSPLVRLMDPSLASLRVSGAFRQGDTIGFARSIAAAFNLKLERARDGSLLLRPAAPSAPTS